MPFSMPNLVEGYQCSNVELGPRVIGSFATYEERQKNSTQCDIDYFAITFASSKTLKGEVKVSGSEAIFPFRAACTAVLFNGFHELRLKISADPESRINNCSGILNFFNQSFPFFESIYLGAGSLITNDFNFSFCEGLRYGVVYKPSLQ